MADKPKLVRVREPGKCALLNPETGSHEVPDPTVSYSADHPLVKAHPWAFGSDEEVHAEREAAAAVDSVQIERAVAIPGQRRNVRR